MISRGQLVKDGSSFDIFISHNKKAMYLEVVLSVCGQIFSAYKREHGAEYVYNKSLARETAQIIEACIRKCTSKNCSPVPWKYGVLQSHDVTVAKKATGTLLMDNGNFVSCVLRIGESESISVVYGENREERFNLNIPYVKMASALVVSNEEGNGATDLDSMYPIRSVEEIMTTKEDLEWLKKVKYYVVNDEETAEQLFSFFEKYPKSIAYDTETTGTSINCFGKIGSSYKKKLEQYNIEHPDDKINADSLVGIIFCVEPHVSYYFPAKNRKFKNLYSDMSNPVTRALAEKIKASYTIGEYRDRTDDMAVYVRETPTEELPSDVLLMERNRKTLETRKIVPHNSSFEWKVDWLYNIDTNVTDDTMLLHQLMYKFRNMVSDKGEPSNLKYLSKTELGIDQWSLEDFFVNYKEKKTKGHVRGGNRAGTVDFSYMDYNGTRIYAPADGDCTLQLLMKYKKDLMENHSDLIYIYQVELLVSCAIGYMEFYGHRIDENKIEEVRREYLATKYMKEYEMRRYAKYNNTEEDEAYRELANTVNARKEFMKNFKHGQTDHNTGFTVEKYNDMLLEKADKLRKCIDNNKEHVINFGAPAQVADLFYNKMNIETVGDKVSVAKNSIKALSKMKIESDELDENGKRKVVDKYPIVIAYSEYKSADTMLTKFFDNLQYFMYPDGIIFSSYGQISTATGRMSCREPNAQQYPKPITKIVVPREGYIHCDADYSQIEYRTLAAMSKNQKLIELFSNPDNDYHTLMAAMMFNVPYEEVTKEMRKTAKSFNFGIPYGMGIASLAILLHGIANAETKKDAQEKYDMYMGSQPETKRFFERTKEQAKVNGMTKTYWNRERKYVFTDKNGVIDRRRMGSVLRQAGNAVIQGTAADIFKIGVARMFSFIRENNLFGDFLIVNMVHDEQLFEINYEKLNVQKALAAIKGCMQMNIEGFPPLFIGAGINTCWGLAKDGVSEIHPNLLDQMCKEVETVDIRSGNNGMDAQQITDYFQSRIIEFSRDKIEKYMLDTNNVGKNIHPVIATLLKDRFLTDGLTKDSSIDDVIDTFIRNNKLDVYGVRAEMFKANVSEVIKDEEETDYDEDGEVIDGELVGNEKEYKIISESDKVYGSTLQDLIKTFKVAVIPSKHILGIATDTMWKSAIEDLADYISGHAYTDEYIDEEDDSVLEVVFLKAGNVLNHTGIYVKDIDEDELTKITRKRG